MSEEEEEEEIFQSSLLGKRFHLNESRHSRDHPTYGSRINENIEEEYNPYGDTVSCYGMGQTIADSINCNPHMATQFTLTSIHNELGRATSVEAVIMMTNCIVGSGMLNYPYGYRCAGGIVNAFCIQVIFVSLVYGSLVILGKCTRETMSTTYQDTVRECCGAVWATLVKICIAINNITACMLMLVILGDNLDMLNGLIVGKHFTDYWYLNRKLLVPIIATVIVLPLCFLKSFHLFRYTSYVGVCATFYITFILTIVRFGTGVTTTREYTPSVPLKSLDFLKFLPVIFFGFEAHIETPPMMAILKDRSYKNYLKTLSGYFTSGLMIYNIVGIFGYLTFGNEVHQNFILSYSRTDPMAMVAIAFLSVKILVTFPVLFFCVRIVVEDSIKKRFPQTTDACRRNSLAVCGFCLCVMVSILIPNIGDALNLIGGLLALLLFFFPGLCYIYWNRGEEAYLITNESFLEPNRQTTTAKLKFLIGCFYILLGLIGGVFMTCTAVVDFVQNYAYQNNAGVNNNVTHLLGM